jgi:hypothetical protein
MTGDAGVGPRGILDRPSATFDLLGGALVIASGIVPAVKQRGAVCAWPVAGRRRGSSGRSAALERAALEHSKRRGPCRRAGRCGPL